MVIKKLHEEFGIGDLETLDLTKLPTTLGKLLRDIKDIEEDIPIDSLLLDVLVKMSQVLNFRKLKLETVNGEITTINIYAMIFMESGAGKDRPLSMMDRRLFPEIFDMIERQYEVYKEKRLREVNADAEVKYPKGALRNKYIAEHSPKPIHTEMTGYTTPEGFDQCRGEMDQANYGGTFIKIGEFGDYVHNASTAQNILISTLEEVFDTGDSKPKTIKADNTNRRINSVASTALFHSTINRLQNDEGRERLLSMLVGGMARRCFLCYPEVVKNKMAELDYEGWQKERQGKLTVAYRDIDTDWRTWINGIYKALNTSKIWQLSPEGLELYLKYTKFSNLIEFDKYTDEAIVAERYGRGWKMIKLAALLAILEHAEIPTVYGVDVEHAIYLTEYYGKYMDKLISNPQITPVDKLFNFFLQNVNKVISKGDIRRLNLVKRFEFPKWLEDSMEEINLMAERDDMSLQVNKVKKGVFYKLVKINKTDLNKIKVSVSQEKGDHPTNGYGVYEIAWDDIYKIANGINAYSPSEFKDGYRDKNHYIAGASMIVLDIDDGWTIAQAQEFLKEKDLIATITTTRNHQKEKNGKVCDRFRIFLPTTTEIDLGAEDFSKMMAGVMELFLNKPDRACKDASRFYYGNPNGEVYYSDGKKLFDWTSLQEKKEEVYTDFSSQNMGGTDFQDLYLKGDFARIRELTKWDQNFIEGHRNSYAAQVFLWFKDHSHLTFEENKNIIRILNNGALSDQELNSTVFSKNKAY